MPFNFIQRTFMKFKHAKDEEHGKDVVLKETHKGENENYK